MWIIVFAWFAFCAWGGWKLSRVHLRRHARKREEQWEHEADMAAWKYDVQKRRLRDQGWP